MALVDARGYSCPQPVLMLRSQMKAQAGGEITILVDTDVSKENVIRSATSEGWEVKEVKPEGGEYVILLTKQVG